MKSHTLKTWPEFFERVWDGSKPFELRKDDRRFDVGDKLLLVEWDLNRHKPETGRSIDAVITYVLRSWDIEVGLMTGFVVLGIKVKEKVNTKTDGRHAIGRYTSRMELIEAVLADAAIDRPATMIARAHKTSLHQVRKIISGASR